MLEVSRIMDPRGQQDHPRGGDMLRRKVFEHVPKFEGVVGNRTNACAAEDRGEKALHHLAILQHIRNPGRTAQVVFEHINLTIAMSHQISARYVAPYSPGRIPAYALLSIRFSRVENLARQYAVFDDFLVMINVVDEEVQ